MRGSDVIFDCVHLLYYKCHKINPNHGRSYIDSPDWIKNKKAFQYDVTLALHHKEIGKYPERITN